MTNKVPSDPLVKIISTKAPTGKTPLPVLEWPAFDRTAWLKAKAAVDIFDNPHRGNDWAPASWRKAEVGYGRWLRWLTLHHPDQVALASILDFALESTHAKATADGGLCRVLMVAGAGFEPAAFRL